MDRKLFNDIVSTETYLASGDMTDRSLLVNLKGMGRTLEILRKTNKNFSEYGRVPANIRTRHLPKRIPLSYRIISPLSRL